MKHKIAQVTGLFSGAGGGVPRAVADFIGAVQMQGIEVVLFTGETSEFPVDAEVFKVENCEIVSSRLVGPTVLGLAVGALKALYIRANEFDVIHLNGAWNLTTFIGSRIARARNVPYVITAHSHLGEYHRSRLAWLKNILFLLFEKNNVRDARAIHVTCDWEQETSAKARAGNDSLIKVPYAMDLNPLIPPASRDDARSMLGLNKDDFYVVSFGRIARQKNPLFLVDAFCKADLPDTAHLVFVGPSEKEMREELTNMIKSSQMEGQISIIDYVSGEEKRSWLAAGDLFALPSFDDNLCIAALESAASGTKCLLSPFVGVVEYLPDEFIDVRPLESSAWQEALKKYFQSRPVQLKFPQECVDQFLPSTIGESWLNFYKSL